MQNYNFSPQAPNILDQQAFWDTYQDTRHINLALAESQIQAEKEIRVYVAKQEISTQHRIHREEQKLWRRILENERNRNFYDELTITPEGAITATVRNLYDNAQPRVITNMRSPKLVHLVRLNNQEESIYQVTASIADSIVSIYLDGRKIANGTYLVQRFAAKGILFLAKAAAQKKDYAQLFLGVLLAQNPQSVFVPDHPGWTDFPDSGFLFITEEELTWSKIKILTK